MKERKIEDINWEIQCKREEMLFVANHYGLNHELTIKNSQDLDKLINEYFNVQMKSNRQRMNFYVVKRNGQKSTYRVLK
ncbi:MAG: aspartyl-phosphate phosphatase Spo0E family protein [Bacillus sp. (in: firmicutes)]